MRNILACIFATLLVMCLVPVAGAESGRETLYQPPMEVEIMYNSEGYAYRAKDINDVVRWGVLEDGRMVVYDSSGDTAFLVETNGAVVAPKDYVFVDYTAAGTSTYTASESYDTYYVQFAQTMECATCGGAPWSGLSGVSMFLPAWGETQDGRALKFIGIISSGTSDLVLCANNPVLSGSGTTDWIIDTSGTTGWPTSGGLGATYSFIHDVVDANYENVTLMFRYGSSSGSTWYLLDQR